MERDFMWAIEQMEKGKSVFVYDCFGKKYFYMKDGIVYNQVKNSFYNLSGNSEEKNKVILTYKITQLKGWKTYSNTFGIYKTENDGSISLKQDGLFIKIKDLDNLQKAINLAKQNDNECEDEYDDEWGD